MTLHALNKSDELDGKVFHAIQDSGQPLSDPASISRFMAQNGVDAAAWDKAFNSFEVNTSIVTADTLFRQFDLKGVPAFIVNGKYLVQGDDAKTLKVVNKLLEQK